MKIKLSFQTKKLIREALCEDVGKGDITTQSLIPRALRAKTYIQAKSDGILAGGEAVSEVFHAVDPTLIVKTHARDGAKVKKEKRVFSIRGRASSILKGERTALNFLSRLSGIATLAHRFVEQVKGTKAKIYDTRKTTPLWRELEKSAVRAGGGFNHRFGLWDQVLVKDNHWAVMKSSLRGAKHPSGRHREASKAGRGDLCIDCFARLRRACNDVFIEVEVKNLKELVSVLPLRPDAILLDNFSVSRLRQAAQIAKAFRKKPILEASGGVHLGNVRSIAKTGVDRISVGALTHSVPALDFSLEFS